MAAHSRNELGRTLAEHVVVRHLPTLLRLDPFRTQTVLTAPLLEHGAQSDDVQERALAHHASDHRAVVVVEVAVDRDAAAFSKGNRLFDLAAFEILLAQLAHDRVAETGTRASAQI